MSTRFSPRQLLAASIVVAVMTIGLKTAAWWFTGSVGLLSDAMESLVNLASATFGLVMVTVAARPADDDHPYGHGKAEYFSSGFEGILIIAAAVAIIWSGVQRLFSPQPLEQVGLGLVLSVTSSVLNGALAFVMMRAAKAHRSLALEADARHLYTDVWTSVGVVVGIGLVGVTGWLWLDAVVAIGVALNILREGAHLIWRSSQGLMDVALTPEEVQKIEMVLMQHTRPVGENQRSEAVYFDHLATRHAGPQRFASAHMHVPAHWTLGHAALLREQVRQDLEKSMPDLHVTLELLPEDE